MKKQAKAVAPKKGAPTGKETTTKAKKDEAKAESPVLTKKLALALRERFKDIRKEKEPESPEESENEEVEETKVGKKRPAREEKQAPPQKKSKVDASEKPAQKEKKAEEVKDEEDEEDEEEDWGEEEDEDDEEDENLIKELEGQDEESAQEEEEEEEEEEGEDFVKLEPKKRGRRKLEAPAAPDSGRGVIYLGHIPHGFYEKEMRAYFSQFGKVTRMRLSRSKRSGHSKGYAFIEFEHDIVADIVAEAMHGYLLFGRVLVCKKVPLEKCHPKLWVGCNKRMNLIPKRRIERRNHNKPKKPEQYKSNVRRLLKTEKAKRKKLQELGIDYDFPGYEIQRTRKGKVTKFD